MLCVVVVVCLRVNRVEEGIEGCGMMEWNGMDWIGKGLEDLLGMILTVIGIIKTSYDRFHKL